MKALNYCLLALFGLAIFTSSCQKDEEELITISDIDIIGNWSVTSVASESDIATGASINFIDSGTLYVTGLGSGNWNILNNEIVLNFSNADDITLTVTANNENGEMTLADESGLVYVIEKTGGITITVAELSGYWNISSVSGTSSYSITTGMNFNFLSTGSFGMSSVGYGTWNIQNSNEVLMEISGTTITLSVIAISNEGSSITLLDTSGIIYEIGKGSLIMENSNIIGSWELTSLSAVSAYGLTVGTTMTFVNDGTLEMSGFGTGAWLIQNDDEIELNIAGTEVVMTAVFVENDGNSISIADAQGIVYVLEKTIIVKTGDLTGDWAVTSVTGTSAYGITSETLIVFATEGGLNLLGNMVGSGTWGIQNNYEIALNIFSADIVMSVTAIEDGGATFTFTDPQGVIYVIEKTIILTENNIKGNWTVASVTGTSAYGITTSTLIEFETGGVLNLSGDMVGTGTWEIQNRTEIKLNIFNTDIIMTVTAKEDNGVTISFTDAQGVSYVIVKNT